MSAIHLQPPAGFASGPSRHAPARAWLRRARRRLGATLRGWRRRSRERAALARFDQRALLDIGLSPADAEFLAQKPFWRE